MRNEAHLLFAAELASKVVWVTGIWTSREVTPAWTLCIAVNVVQMTSEEAGSLLVAVVVVLVGVGFALTLAEAVSHMANKPVVAEIKSFMSAEEADSAGGMEN